jgi:hypothetical protein
MWHRAMPRLTGNLVAGHRGWRAYMVVGGDITSDFGIGLRHSGFILLLLD